MEFPIKIDISREHKTIRKNIRIEEDKFEVCQPKEVRKRKLIGEDIWLVHRTENSWNIEKLK